MVTVPELLYTLLALGGIKCKDLPSLYVGRTVLGVEHHIKIETMGQLIKNFGVGMYQIFVTHPEISGIDTKTFRIKTLSINIAYEGKGKWSEPFIRTEEEEITPEFADDFKKLAHERAKKVALKLKDAALVLYQFINIMEEPRKKFSAD